MNTAIYKVIAAQGNIIEASNVMQEAVSVNGCLPDEWDKNLGLQLIASALAKQGEMEKAKEFIHAISDEIDEATAMTEITSILAKEGKIEAAIQCAQEINYDYDASIAISGICIELAKIEKWPLVEKISMDIPEIGERIICWKTIANNAYKDKGWKNAIRQLEQLQSKEIKAYYLKGLAESIDLIDTNKALIINANKYYRSDTESMQTLMQQYALHELFFQSPSTQRIERFNRTLNIQWAIDVKSNLN